MGSAGASSSTRRHDGDVDAALGASTLSPCAHRASARWGDVLLATSDRAIRAEHADGRAELWFPIGDVRLEALRATPDSPRFWDVADDVHEDGRRVLWERHDETCPAGLDGHATFDHDRVVVELEDSLSDDPRDTTYKRFPTWGDASQLVQLLDVMPVATLSYVGTPRVRPGRAVAEGSQTLAQAIVAAMKHVPDRRVVSAHMAFCRPVDANLPLEFVIEEHAVHRTMATLGLRVTQTSKTCAAGTVLLDAGADDVMRHAAAHPDTPRPYGCESWDASMTGRDIRLAGGANQALAVSVGPPTLDAWVRFGAAPDLQYLHTALAIHFMGRLSISAAMRPHEQVALSAAHRTLSTAVNAISVTFHADVRADRWLLYRHHSTFAGDGMTHSECRVYTETGDLVASFTVDAMVRRLDASRSAPDRQHVL